jgi:hypothetical protein
MPTPSKSKAAKLRSWWVSTLRHRAEDLGNVQVLDEKAAEAAAVAQFNLSEAERLMVSKQD